MKELIACFNSFQMNTDSSALTVPTGYSTVSFKINTVAEIVLWSALCPEATE